MKEFLRKKNYYLFSEAIRNRCAWCNGAGTVLFPFDRNDHQYTGKSAAYPIFDYDCGNSQ